jgi:hypothetical protein
MMTKVFVFGQPPTTRVSFMGKTGDSSKFILLRRLRHLVLKVRCKRLQGLVWR